MVYYTDKITHSKKFHFFFRNQLHEFFFQIDVKLFILQCKQ